MMLKFIFKLLAFIPISLRRKIALTIGTLIAAVPTKERQVAKLQLDLILGPGSSIRYLRETYRQLALCFAEAIDLNGILVERPPAISCNDIKLFIDLASNKGPFLLLSAHTGNWELLGAYIVSLGAKLAVVAKDAKNSVLQDQLALIRHGYGAQVFWRSDKSVAKKMLTWFKAGGTVASMIDQDTKVHSAEALFFSRAVQVPDTALEIARRANARIVCVLNFRSGVDTYEVRIKEFDSKLSNIEIIELYHRELEQGIKDYPAQWVWMHKRWRSRQDGTKLRTDEYIEFLRGEIERAEINR